MTIVDELIRKYRGKADLHITRVMCAWIVISNGRIVEIDRTQALRTCPLQRMLARAGIEEYIYEKIRQFGHFTAEREVVRASLGVPFGTSEMFMYALQKKVLDCVITVCDGAGTVVTSNPEIVQGIGARMNGLFYTTPIPEVQAKLRQHNCIIFDDARIDQIRGLNAAINAGYTRIGITVNSCYGENFGQIRQIEKAQRVDVSVAAICSTGVDKKRAEEAAQHADLAWSCASKHMRDSGRNAILQITQGIPIFVYTPRGLDIVAAYSDDAGAKAIKNLDPQKQYLLSSQHGDSSILLGENFLSLTETRLPVQGKHEPVPLR